MSYKFHQIFGNLLFKMYMFDWSTTWILTWYTLLLLLDLIKNKVLIPKQLKINVGLHLFLDSYIITFFTTVLDMKN